jgi:hypothetical protein
MSCRIFALRGAGEKKTQYYEKVFLSFALFGVRRKHKSKNVHSVVTLTYFLLSGALQGEKTT